METLDLRDLAILSQQGDQVAYTRFLRQITPYIQSAVRSKLGGLVEADDICQDCLMGIHRNLASYQPDQPIKPWIAAIIRYKLADHFRKLAKRREEPLTDDSFVTNEPEVTNNQGEGSVTEITQILAGLPVKLKRALELTHIQGLSYQEAASKEGISEVALRKRISRAFLKVKKHVEKKVEINLE